LIADLFPDHVQRIASTFDALDAAQAEMAALPRVEHDDLRRADGIVWGTPTRFGCAGHAAH
jgi:multimeric flavodoxin WrbA